MERILGDSLLGKQGSISTSVLSQADMILLYFSASWCPPCRQFTPVLANFYNQVNASRKQVEIIYVSWDQTIQQFTQYYDHMPWLAIPFDSTIIKDRLYESLAVNSVPTLILIDRTGRVVNRECRKEVAQNGVKALDAWRKALH
ncbi:hypothetical protein SteCoe_15207 [Stentor coeruleus]|uniref:Thioredoxin domain-containing protein n=1 Tax=Stentor coeruleus TaxID=5963 RepID=A0A1R2C439_9CILI|nr:hypothetical protein SteCoe_15207 [Stentor coeruleus]